MKRIEFKKSHTAINSKGRKVCYRIGYVYRVKDELAESLVSEGIAEVVEHIATAETTSIYEPTGFIEG
jgi:hypothetical protein